MPRKKQRRTGDYANCRSDFVNDRLSEPTDSAARANHRPPWHLPEQLAGYAIATVFFTLTGPFETYAMSLPLRLSYWAGAVAAGWLSVTGAIALIRRLPFTTGWTRMQRTLTGMAAGALLAVFAVWAFDTVFDRALGRGTGSAPLYLMALNVGAISALIGGIFLIRLRPRLIEPAPLPKANPFLARLPRALGQDLISLTAQDHYVEVVTAKGRELILMRFSDALEELSNYPGTRIHRSHWISAHAFAGHFRDNDRLMARLTDGSALPVSRSYAALVRRMKPVENRDSP
ncbi:LytTR family DNA-binding domain-containing protein [Rhodalgimonas zhirmunskyi]|uniref:LytTR family transcriptional regulator n=1 Tax=Rhodalgimonas zhirmunskyi TaxID=2964767 RepID=A0AAJ1X8K7_9RHOB|nr:LytTR family DNA-binding domain-containing protein [Rhodoalgimonas zhirmunskyi]MDQ2095737.1 LytTR family transcriptional regulator [Rhodoalgimonas zhirmunskyi]